MIILEIMRMRRKQKVVPQTVILYISRDLPDQDHILSLFPPSEENDHTKNHAHAQKTKLSSTNCHPILCSRDFPKDQDHILWRNRSLFPLPRKLITLEVMHMRRKQKVVPQTVILYCSRDLPKDQDHFLWSNLSLYPTSENDHTGNDTHAQLPPFSHLSIEITQHIDVSQKNIYSFYRQGIIIYTRYSHLHRSCGSHTHVYVLIPPASPLQADDTHKQI